MSAQRIIMFKSYESTKTTIFKTWKSHDDLSRFLSTTFLGSLVMHFSKNAQKPLFWAFQVILNIFGFSPEKYLCSIFSKFQPVVACWLTEINQGLFRSQTDSGHQLSIVQIPN